MRISDWSSDVCSSDLGDLAATLEATIAMHPARIALFGYAHMPRLLPRQRRIDAGDLPDLAARFAMAAQGHETLTGAGYEAIGFDHFALPEDAMARAAREGRLRRNFQGFTDDPADIRSEEHTSELQSLMRTSYAVFCLKKKKLNNTHTKQKHD